MKKRTLRPWVVATLELLVAVPLVVLMANVIFTRAFGISFVDAVYAMVVGLWRLI